MFPHYHDHDEQVAHANTLSVPHSPKPSSITIDSRRSSTELREEYAELLEERSRPSSRNPSRTVSRDVSRERPATKESSKDAKDSPCGSDCDTCGNCNTIKDTVLELDDNSTSKIKVPTKHHHHHHHHNHSSRRKPSVEVEVEISGPYDTAGTPSLHSQLDFLNNNSNRKEKDEEQSIPAACSSDSIEQKLGFDMTLLSF
ncbi:hypothetical protein BGX29_008694 [Mortierella sp. GBA35]|nr:hypothetical protein BGX29_008694 [Mortierella sp. GBA35]